MMQTEIHRHGDIYDIMREVDKSYADLPDSLRLKAKELSQNLMQIGSRSSKRAGIGIDTFSFRPFDKNNDKISDISARHSMRNPDAPIVIEREHEQKHNVGLWRAPDMNYKISKDAPLKRDVGEIMILALMMQLAKHQDAVSVVEGDIRHRLGRNTQHAADQLREVSVFTGTDPDFTLLPKKSTVVLADDFFDKEKAMRFLEAIEERNHKGFFIMLLDPVEMSGNIPSNVELHGRDGDISQSGRSRMKIADAGHLKEAWRKALISHVFWLKRECEKRNCELLLHSTDSKISNTLMKTLSGDLDNPMKAFGLDDKQLKTLEAA